MLHRSLGTLLLMLLLPVLLPAQDQNSLLWEIRVPGVDKPSFLYGTIHIQDERAFQFGDSVMICFDRCEVIAGELDLKEAPDMMFGGFEMIMMPDSTELEDLYTPEDYKRLKAAITKKLGFVGAFVDRLKPLFTYTLLSEADLPKDQPVVLDQYLQQEGRKKGKTVIGLETINEQLSAIDHISLKDQAQMLLDYIDNPIDGGDYYEQLVETYAKGDLDGLHLLYEGWEGTSDALDDALVVNRNHTMAGRIRKLIARQSAFICVGALHLPGEEGLIELLKKDGMAMRPVYSYSTKAGETDFLLHSKAGNFEVRFPQGPAYFASEAEGPGATAHNYAVSDDQGRTWTLSVQIAEEKRYYSYTELDLGSKASTEEMTIAGLEAKKYTMKEAGNKQTRIYQFGKDNRTYFISLSEEDPKRATIDDAAFLNSFRLLEK